VKSYFVALMVSLGLTACATAPSKSANTVASTSASATSADELYSNSEIIGIMLGGGKRNPEKLAARVEAVSAFPLGSERNPVRAHRPQGEQAYLKRLNCADGAKPEFKRRGSFGAGPFETILDGYDLTCSGVPVEGLIYMDMYHSGHIENLAIAGFSIDKNP